MAHRRGLLMRPFQISLCLEKVPPRSGQITVGRSLWGLYRSTSSANT